MSKNGLIGSFAAVKNEKLRVKNGRSKAKTRSLLALHVREDRLRLDFA